MTNLMTSISNYTESIVGSAGRLLRMFGPGLVTGAANDDPSGIATYSQAGAQFGYTMSWTMFLTTPFMIAIQMVTARIGAVTGNGLAANLRKALPDATLYLMVGLLLIANTINIAADIAAMGDCLTARRRRILAGLCRVVRDRLSHRGDPGAVSPLFAIPENSYAT